MTTNKYISFVLMGVVMNRCCRGKMKKKIIHNMPMILVGNKRCLIDYSLWFQAASNDYKAA